MSGVYWGLSAMSLMSSLDRMDKQKGLCWMYVVDACETLLLGLIIFVVVRLADVIIASFLL